VILQQFMQFNSPISTKEMKTKNMTALHLRKSIGRSPLRLALPRVRPPWIIRGFLLIPLVLAWVAASPPARAQLPSPTPDGGYPNGNTAEGEDALFSLTTGFGNTAVGNHALYSNTTGNFNTAEGYAALSDNTTGLGNTANGYIALSSNTIGEGNTATGYQTLIVNTTGERNTANGIDALFSNTTGSSNTANGGSALGSNTTGEGNTATGVSALINNTTGNGNTAVGVYALQSNATGSGNIALGTFAGTNLTTGDNNIDIGNEGAAADANTIRIGTVETQTNAYVAGIYQAHVARGVGVVIDSTGHLGTRGSSERFKQAIKPMDKASEAILALKPVTFHYKKELDPEGIPQFGLVAEEVEKVNPDLVARDAEGKPYTVRYEAVNAMLLNEFLKEHRTVMQLETTVARQQKKFESKIANQQKEIEVLTAGLRKVSAQLEASKPAPQVVLNNP